MSEILINGLEMPPDGRYTLCITHDSDGGAHWVFQNQDTLEFLKHGAVTEVPEPHGDLIDASEKIRVQMYDDEHEDFHTVEMTIDDLLSQSWVKAYAYPVIPASRGG